MSLPELIILDVGHGNCAILRDTKGTIIIDCASSETVADTLETLGISQIEAVILSHSDTDHIGGLIGLLVNPNISIKQIYLNADPRKETETWRQGLSSAIRISKNRNIELRVKVGLTAEDTNKINAGAINVEILWPTFDIAMAGVGGKTSNGKTISANAMSIVIRLVHQAKPIALLPGDMDNLALENLVKENANLEANVLIFPHHGGRPGSVEPIGFAKTLCEQVKPNLVIFSIGRGKHDTPRPEIVRGIRQADPDVHILCTQLSMHCSIAIPNTTFSHLGDYPAGGRIAGHCCGGTVVINIAGAETDYLSKDDHSSFVRNHITMLLCTRAIENL